MALPISIESILTLAKVCQYLAFTDEQKQKAFKGGSPFVPLSQILYTIRTSVEWKHGVTPNDESLIETGNYLYSLLGPYRNKAITIIANANAAAPTVTNPASLTVAEGASATFTVTATGQPTLYYQWLKNGVAIVGATSSSYTIPAAVEGDEGSYSVQVTAANGSVSSAAATLTVTNVLTGYYWSGVDDPYPLLSIGFDNLTYSGTFNITPGGDLSVPFASGSVSDDFTVVKYPIAEGVKADWYNTALNNGPIPDAIMRDVLTIGSFLYVISRSEYTLDTSFSPNLIIS